MQSELLTLRNWRSLRSLHLLWHVVVANDESISDWIEKGLMRYEHHDTAHLVNKNGLLVHHHRAAERSHGVEWNHAGRRCS